jgi:hypothetical protein
MSPEFTLVAQVNGRPALQSAPKGLPKKELGNFIWAINEKMALKKMILSQAPLINGFAAVNLSRE